jgi:hypothetical protein
MRADGTQDCRIKVSSNEGSTEYKRGYNENGIFESTVTVKDKNGKGEPKPAGTEVDKRSTEHNFGIRTVELTPVRVDAPRVVSETRQHVQIGLDRASERRPEPPAPQLPAGPKVQPESPAEKLSKAPIVDFEKPDKDQPEKKKTTSFDVAENKPDPVKSQDSRPEQQSNRPSAFDHKSPEPREKQPPAAASGPDAGDIAFETAGEIATDRLKDLRKLKVPTDLKQALAVINVAISGAMILPILTIGALEKSQLGKPKSAQELKLFKEQMKTLKELSTFQGLLKDVYKNTVKEISNRASRQLDQKVIPHKAFETDQNMTGPSPSHNQA